MYNWTGGRKFSNSKSLPTFYLTSKHFNPFLSNAVELSSFKQLPVIKEEEGCTSADEVELSLELLQNSLLKKTCGRGSTFYMTDSSEHLKRPQGMQGSISITKLPPLMNINCLMNTDIKHTQPIWNTNFGKRLIHGKNFDENLDLTDIKKAPSDVNKKGSNKFGDCQTSISSIKQKSIQEKNIKNDGDKIDYGQIKYNKKKPKKIKKIKKNLVTKKSTQEINHIVKNSEPQLSEKFFETVPKESHKDIQTVSSFSKKQRFLTECVKSILDSYSTQIICEYCKETLQNIEEFKVHKKQHEAEKEICLLCDKIFYNSNKFIQHLLTHESVDCFSCKKCKKYFPNLKKYNQHCQDFHVAPSDNISSKGLQNFEKWLPKFECKQCRIDFESEKVKEDHRRDHIKKDLAGAYLLSPKNIMFQ